MALDETFKVAGRISALGVAALALGGCMHRGAPLTPPAPPANYALEPMDPCNPVVAPGDVVATISITVPRRLNFAGFSRDVSWAPNYVDPTTPRLGLGHGNGAHQPEPFDVIIADATRSTTGYVLIRAAIPRGGSTNVSFAQVGAMMGLARGYVAPAPSNVLCGATIAHVGTGTVEDVAYFYLNLSQWTDRSQYVPFAIIVQAGDLYATPIIIDPKLRND